MKIRKGINMGGIKQKNRVSILNLIRGYGAMPRTDIAKQVELTPASVTIIVNKMIDEGVIKEMGELEENDKRAGRKKILIDINYDIKFVIGISIESEICSIGVANIKGTVINSTSMCITKELEAEETLQIIANQCISLLWKENVAKENILGVGVGIIGPVNSKEGVSKHAYGLWKKEVNVKKILEKQLNINVVVDNNVRTLAIAEMDHEKLQNISNMLFIKGGPGIGSAIVIDREIYSGTHNTAAEIGHTIVEINGETCKCGKVGCLETVASPEAINRKIRGIFSRERAPILYRLCAGDITNLSTNNIMKSSQQGDEEVIKIITKAAIYMALGISNALTIIDPQKLVLYGEMFMNEIFMETLKEELNKNLTDCDLRNIISYSALNDRPIYVGGIALAIREFFFRTGAMN
ncbi:ROK family transcriptional regulator [Clostridium frigoris]|uniref:ROK family transcriptional regulator n=1 Tax=Clostridium frigoris TaxID=205327 RepID=A0ABS6BVN7_9CLOT|nr:ROK family transcriptional regulator [Clostridium frigoris]MBU3160991.1 ROK family transcriptional regulator [Clostridium frigoris]